MLLLRYHDVTKRVYGKELCFTLVVARIPASFMEFAILESGNHRNRHGDMEKERFRGEA
jgi:hypothetical protein